MIDPDFIDWVSDNYGVVGLMLFVSAFAAVLGFASLVLFAVARLTDPLVLLAVPAGLVWWLIRTYVKFKKDTKK